jgi:hypothetical protein
MRVLKVVGDIDVNLDLPEDTEITEIGLEDYLEATYEEKFDLIFCVHVLQALWASQVSDVIGKLVSELKQGGELHIHVPATEQAAKALLLNETDPVAFYMIWGTEKRPFHTGFTLLWLRAILTQVGAIVRNANMGIYNLTFNGREAKAVEHVVIATVIRD